VKGVKMVERRGKADYLFYDIDQIIVDADRCLECQQKQVCVSYCALGLEIPQAMAAIAHHVFVVPEGVRAELAEASAAAYAREAVRESFSDW